MRGTALSSRNTRLRIVNHNGYVLQLLPGGRLFRLDGLEEMVDGQEDFARLHGIGPIPLGGVHFPDRTADALIKVVPRWIMRIWGVPSISVASLNARTSDCSLPEFPTTECILGRCSSATDSHAMSRLWSSKVDTLHPFARFVSAEDSCRISNVATYLEIP
jgi:hypothetical protein